MHERGGSPAGPRARLGLLGAIVLYAIATTFPFEVERNGARLEPTGAMFPSAGVLWWAEPSFRVPRRQLSLEVTARTTSVDQRGPARLVTYSADPYDANVTLGQQGDTLVVRLRRPGSSPVGAPPFLVPGVFSTAQDIPFRVDVSTTRLSVSVDGRSVLDRELDADPFATWRSDFAVALGNEVTGERPWLGELRTVRLTSDDLTHDLLDPLTLRRPSYLDWLRQRVMILSASLADVLANFFLLVPMGWLTAGALRRHAVARTAALWLLLALLVEGLQVLLPGRFPALSDLVLNVLGATLGAAWRSRAATRR